MIDIVENTGKFSSICRCTRCQNEYLVKCRYDADKSPIGDLCEKCKKPLQLMKQVTKTALLEELVYNAETGEITLKHRSYSGNIGDIATHAHSKGYLSIMIGRKSYLAHRIIHLMQTGYWPVHIDHINQIKNDNRWINLRNVEQTDNNRNMPIQLNSYTGVTGVSLYKATGKYRAYISIKGKAKHLGLFDTIEEAAQARKEADILYGYHTNHGKYGQE